MSDIYTDFLEGIAGVLVTAGAVYRPAGPKYIATETGIALRRMPDDGDGTPDTMIVLNAYQAGGGDPFLTVDAMRLQAYTRGTDDPRSELSVRGLVYGALRGLRNLQLGSVHLGLLDFISSIDMGADARGRFEGSTNFTADIDVPTTALRS